MTQFRGEHTAEEDGDAHEAHDGHDAHGAHEADGGDGSSGSTGPTVTAGAAPVDLERPTDAV